MRGGTCTGCTFGAPRVRRHTDLEQRGGRVGARVAAELVDLVEHDHLCVEGEST